LNRQVPGLDKKKTIMRHMIQLHNTEKEGYRPSDLGPAEIDGKKCATIYTRKRLREETVQGNRVWVIRTDGTPRSYFLCYTFIVDKMDKTENPFCVYGHEGITSFEPEIPLDHRVGWFKHLYERMNNFSLGFSFLLDEEVAEFEMLAAKHNT
jgi:hypothetical protein